MLNSSMMQSGDRILVTGATGFVGSAVARLLDARSLAVRVLARPTSPRRNLEGLNCEVVLGDMTDASAMNRALGGVRFLFHVAADYRLWAPNSSEIIRNNREGTLAVMQAALDQGVERIVYTSSVATLRAANGSVSVDETASLAEGEGIGSYKKSKVLAERLVERMVAEQALPAVIVNPSTTIGQRDLRPTPTGRILIEAACGRIPVFADTGLNLVHVDDVAAGHLTAMEKGRIGERYILGGQNASLREMLAAIAKLAGRKPPTINIPRAPIYPLAYAAEALGRITGKEPFLTVDALEMASHYMFFTSAKAELELGYTARPYAEALRDALDWFRRAGMLK
jgi:dihydroflavonol-4-reductase